MKRVAGIVAFLVILQVAPLRAAVSCSSGDDYSDALCSYRHADFQTARQRFRIIVERNEPAPETMKAMYFLARSEMRLGRWDEAQTLFIRIYSLDPPFYRAWNCDFLLGEARHGAGKG
jgi:TolA-binding protein